MVSCEAQFVAFCFFLFYINDLPKIIYNTNNMILFADDTSILVTNPNKIDFNININQTFLDINTWFKDNLLSLNFNNIHYLEFRTKHYYNVNTEIKYDQKYITKATGTKFLGLIIDDTLSWKHIDQVVSKICTACCAIRNIKCLVSQDTLRIIYFTHIHSVLSYGIIFWDNSSYSNKVFILQKKIIRIITNSTTRVSCLKLFKDTKILLMYSQYIYSLILYKLNNIHLYNTNKEIYKNLINYIFLRNKGF